jgi:hypothetical protein
LCPMNRVRYSGCYFRRLHGISGSQFIALDVNLIRQAFFQRAINRLFGGETLYLHLQTPAKSPIETQRVLAAVTNHTVVEN